MKRTTISLPDNVSAALEREARRRRVPVSQVAKEAIEKALLPDGDDYLPFVGIGRSSSQTTGRDMEELIRKEWTIDRDR